jgi:hypothetical protein
MLALLLRISRRERGCARDSIHIDVHIRSVTLHHRS